MSSNKPSQVKRKKKGQNSSYMRKHRSHVAAAASSAAKVKELQLSLTQKVHETEDLEKMDLQQLRARRAFHMKCVNEVDKAISNLSLTKYKWDTNKISHCIWMADMQILPRSEGRPDCPFTKVAAGVLKAKRLQLLVAVGQGSIPSIRSRIPIPCHGKAVLMHAGNGAHVPGFFPQFCLYSSGAACIVGSAKVEQCTCNSKYVHQYATEWAQHIDDVSNGSVPGLVTRKIASVFK